MDMLTIIQGDALESLRQLPADSVQCCVTSPPYFGLRDYGTATWDGGDSSCDHKKSELRRGVNLNQSVASTRGGGKKIAKSGWIPYSSSCGTCGAVRIDQQIGLETKPSCGWWLNHEFNFSARPDLTLEQARRLIDLVKELRTLLADNEPCGECYVCRLVEVFREVRRVLKDDGTCWVNLGDSYAKDGKWGGSSGGKHVKELHGNTGVGRGRKSTGLKPKDLIGIPWQVAFSLRADGWYLRSDIIWHKPNPMPESVTDRPTKAHEYLFLFSKSERYLYDAGAIKQPGKESTVQRGLSGTWHNQEERPDHGFPGRPNRNKAAINRDIRERLLQGETLLVNARTVWTVATQPYTGAHFATFPPDLIKPCILAGTRADDAVLDPFGGSGTTGQVAIENGRRAILIELNPAYIPLIEQRCRVTIGLPLDYH